MKSIIALPVFFLLALVGYGQAADPCQALLEAYAGKMGAYGQGGKGNYRLHMDITALPAEGAGSQPAALAGKTVDLKVTATAKKLAYESTYLAVYRDEKDQFTVIHPQRTILHARAGKVTEATDGAVPAGQLTALQQRFMKRCRIASCRDTVYAGQAAKVMVLLPDPKDQAQYQIKRITNYVLVRSVTVPRQVIEYTEGHGLDRQVVNYHAVDLDYRGKAPGPARAAVFASPGKLLARYQGYRVEEE
ncbi:MAG: hypothetical protein ICV83_14705 [Cytophagales bacterium]|nr:hypothetical protein [Cytophagales bacterium]